jgi:glycosyltransferase involved in cell wall biosynthesis
VVLRRAGFRGPLAVIPQMGVDPERFRPDPGARARVRVRLGIAQDEPLVGFAGRLAPEKGVHVLLDAMAALPGARLLVIGAGPGEARLRQRAEALGIAERVRWAGLVPSAGMSEWLAALDVLALPSLTTRGWAEQFGRVLVEAMACGVAVAGSDSGEIRSVIGDAGAVVPEGSAAALRAVLAELLGDAGARHERGRAGRERVLGAFTQRAVVDATLAFHRQVLSA